MGEWKEYSLDQVLEIVKDAFNPSQNAIVPFIGLEHIEQGTLRLNGWGYSCDVKSSKFKFKQGDILFGKLRPYFKKVVRPKFDGICSTDIWVIRAKPGFDQGYLFYFLATDDFIDTANLGESGTRMPRADWDFLKNTNWIFPPLEEQKEIAEILSSLDDKIDLLHRQNKTLEEMAQTLFRQWFIEEAQDDWEEVELGEVVELKYGKNLTNDKRSEYGYPVYGSNGIIGYTQEALVSLPGIVIGRKGTIGNVKYVNIPFYPIDTTYFVSSASANKDLYYEYFLLKNLGLEELNTDSAVPGLNRNIVHSIKVNKAPDDLISNFVQFCRPLFKKIELIKDQILTIQKIKNFTTKALFNYEP